MMFEWLGELSADWFIFAINHLSVHFIKVLLKENKKKKRAKVQCCICVCSPSLCSLFGRRCDYSIYASI